MELQLIYDTVTNHLLTQKSRSILGSGYGDTNICAYRGKDNLKCAVGILIPDEIYTPQMEGKGLRELIDEFNSIDNLFPTQDEQSLLSMLQIIHDNSSNWDENGLAPWAKTELKAIPDLYPCFNLKPNPKL